LACGAMFDKNFSLRRYFWQNFWSAALFLAKFLDCGAIFWQKFWPAALFLAKILAFGAIFSKSF